MIADQLIFLGYPRSLTADVYSDLNLFGYEPILDDITGGVKHFELSYSLKAAAKRWCNIDIDKSVRGKIINEGLTTEVVLYAAGDVRFLEDIKDKQEEEIKKQNLQKAVIFECEFVKAISYIKYCGIHLDVDKWKAKMKRDQDNLNTAINDLNEYVVSLYNKDKEKYKNFVEYIQPDLFGFNKVGYSCNINWSSSKQVLPLFELLGIKVKTFDKKTRKEKKSIEEKQLSPQKDQFPIIDIFLRYQGAAKLVSTYGQNWLNAVNPVSHRIHVELHSIGTDTGK